MTNGANNSVPWGSLLSTVGSAVIAAAGCAWLVAQAIDQANDELARDIRSLSVSFGRVEERIQQCERRSELQQLQIDRLRDGGSVK